MLCHHSMTDFTSGFNFVTNVSHEKELSGLCGLDEDDVLAALRLPGVCGPDEDAVQKHLMCMKQHFGNYRFYRRDVRGVFNINACLQYLQYLCKGEVPPNRFPIVKFPGECFICLILPLSQ